MPVPQEALDTKSGDRGRPLAWGAQLDQLLGWVRGPGSPRRWLSVATAKAQAESLAGKLQRVGEGAEAVAERRRLQWQALNLDRERSAWRLSQVSSRPRQWGRAAAGCF